MPGTGGQRGSENLPPWKPRRDAIVPEAGHDPYRLTSQPPQPTRCPRCGATFTEGRWSWESEAPSARATVNEERCPACRRIEDNYPAGYLTLSGTFLTSHHVDLVALLWAEAEAEGAEHPLHRVIQLSDRGAQIEITTTDVHLPRRLAEKLHNAFQGTLQVQYAEEDNLVRVSWNRDEEPAAPRPAARPLPVEIQRNGVVVTPDAEAYLQERLVHVRTFYPRILSIRVVFEAPLGHHRTGGPYSLGLFVDVPGKVVAVTRQHADDLHVAIKAAFDAVTRQLEDYARLQRADVSPTQAPPRGRVVRLFPAEGYGFIAAEDGQELYFHRNSVLEAGFDSLEVGMEVRYAEEQGEKGLQASTVVRAD